jgi:transaldolase
VLATDYDGMMAQAAIFTKIAKNIAVKVPLTWDGLKACKALSDQGTMVNVTLCFSAVQAMMAAKAGATFISPFIGRVDDIGEDGMTLIDDIRTVYDNYDFKTQILAASIRSVSHVYYSALAGADVGTMPSQIFKKLLDHPLTEKGLAAFLADAKKANVSIKG